MLRFCLATFLAFAFSLACPGASPNTLSDSETQSGWKLLFDGKSTQGWRSFKKQTFPSQGWDVESGWLHCTGKGGGDIISEGEFEQFDFEWDWKLEPGGNSGVKYFVVETRTAALGHEYQLLDDDKHPDARLGDGKRVTASFYDVLKPEVKPPSKPLGEVNHSRILVRGNHVEHWLNGVKVLEYECGSQATKKAVSKSKFKDTPDFGTRLKGHILLQNHGANVWFQNIKIRDLTKN